MIKDVVLQKNKTTKILYAINILLYNILIYNVYTNTSMLI